MGRVFNFIFIDYRDGFVTILRAEDRHVTIATKTAARSVKLLCVEFEIGKRSSPKFEKALTEGLLLPKFIYDTLPKRPAEIHVKVS